MIKIRVLVAHTATLRTRAEGMGVDTLLGWLVAVRKISEQTYKSGRKRDTGIFASDGSSYTR